MPQTLFKIWTPKNFGWFCGIFEGEGCIYVGHSASGSVKLSVSLGTTDPDVFDRFVRLANRGNVRSHTPKGGTKTFYTWSLTRKEEVLAFLEFIFGEMSERRQEKIYEVRDEAARMRGRGKKTL